MNKKYLIAAITAIIATVAVSSSTIFAESDSNSLVDKIAKKFGLKKEEVQQVFDEHKKEMYVQRQQKFQEYLDQQVKQGKITEEQKQKILQKQQELRQEIEQLKNLDPDRKREQVKQLKQDYQNWLKENNIPLNLKPEKPGFKHFHRMPF
ncbi:MAG: hypothetical protein KatS3mg090_0778 [Patescibacteria group bacterium]|nr:MAG: hypothetical protein KatS3mg090_0778 [Patescibacteria group bacterium]